MKIKITAGNLNLTCDSGTGPALVQVEHVKELLTAKVTDKGFEGLESVHKYHSIALIQEVFGRGGSPCAGTEVVHEPHRVVLQRHRRTTGLKEEE